MTLRARLVALAAAVALLLAGAVIVLARSGNAACSVAAPRPSLPDQLRSLGDFDQAYDASDVALLQDVAQRAAAALHSDLVGTTAEQPVAVAAASPHDTPGALVVPLLAPASATESSPPLHGLVVFLRDCAGNAYYASVEDDTTQQPPLAGFPAVTSADAAARLGGPVTLAYATDPLQPRWVLSADPGQSLAAR